MALDKRVSELRYRHLLRQLEALSEEYEAIQGDLTARIDPVDKVRLKRQANKILKELNHLEQEIEKLKKESRLSFESDHEEYLMSKSSTRNKIFVSYSHIDGEWLKKIQVYLKPLEKRGLVEQWDDTKIRTGMKWRDEIKKALDSTKIAILLVSSNFLASDFILENELPPLLKASEEEGALIFSIILDPCRNAFSLSELEQFQTLNPPTQPLSGMEKHEQGEAFDRLLTDIRANLDLTL